MSVDCTFSFRYEKGKEGGALIFNLAQLVFMLNHARSSRHSKGKDNAQRMTKLIHKSRQRVKTSAVLIINFGWHWIPLTLKGYLNWNRTITFALCACLLTRNWKKYIRMTVVKKIFLKPRNELYIAVVWKWAHPITTSNPTPLRLFKWLTGP